MMSLTGSLNQWRVQLSTSDLVTILLRVEERVNKAMPRREREIERERERERKTYLGLFN
jgi:hypothetical protein